MVVVLSRGNYRSMVPPGPRHPRVIVRGDWLAPGQSHPKRESDTIENPPRRVRRMVYNKERVRDASTFQKVRQYEFPTASYLIPVSMWRK
jgi:hypothetical protein